MKAADRAVITTVRRMTAAARRSQVSEFARTVPGWCQTWKKVRLRCRDCDGYYVYGRNGPYCAAKCGYGINRPTYLLLKGIAVQHALMGYDFPEDVPAYFLVEKAA